MSQCKQILQVLADGREHEMRDIHREVGFCRLNSRVAELRSRGHDIVCRRAGGSYFYRLVLNEAAPAQRAAPPCLSAASLSTPALTRPPLKPQTP
jgi:hypothetical protein